MSVSRGGRNAEVGLSAAAATIPTRGYGSRVVPERPDRVTVAQGAPGHVAADVERVVRVEEDHDVVRKDIEDFSADALDANTS